MSKDQNTSYGKMSYKEEILKIRPANILHCGAHILDELEFYDSFDFTEQVVWVEANKELYDISLNKIAHKEKHKIINKAVTDIDGQKIKFNISNKVWASSIFEFGKDINKYWSHHEHIKQIEVETITIDTIIRENMKNNKVDLLVLDIQGAELLALKGAINTLKYLNSIYIEVIWADAYKNGALKSEIEDFIFPLNFKEVFRYTHSDNHQADILYRR